MPADKSLFGQIALSKGWVDQQTLERCLKLQRSRPGENLLLGQVMVGQGALTSRQVEEILSIQGTMRQSRVIKGYELLSKIGSGGTGAVYKARKGGIDKIVAVKVLSPRLARNRDYISRFFREARAAGMLNHPNIVGGFDVGESNGYYYFAMEYVEGETVAQIQAREGRLSEDRALSIVSQVAEALDHAAAHGLVHRDIKPDNIMITPSGLVKLADLGLAKAHSGDPSVTQEGWTIGTPYYSSPEQARGEHDIDIRSDIYSLGATLFYMVSGRVPFLAATPAAVLAKHLTEDLPPLYEMKRELSEPTARLIKKMMAKNPDRRHLSPRELIDDVQRAILKIHQKAEPAQAVGTSPADRQKRFRWPAAVLGGAAAVVAIFVVVALLRENKPPETAPTIGNDVAEQNQQDPAVVKPTEGPQEDEADKALKRADAFTEKQPDAYDEIIAIYQGIIEEHGGTRAAHRAARRLEEILARRARAADAAVRQALADVKELVEEQKFGAAIEHWARVRTPAGLPGIDDRIADEINKLKQAAAKALAEKSAHADKLLADEKFDEARAVYRMIAENFGLEGAEKTARAALARIDELEQEARDKQLAEERRRVGYRERIYAVNEIVGTLRLNEARKAYEELRRDCPEKLLPLLEERANDLVLLAGLRKAIVEHVNAGPHEGRNVTLRNGQRFTPSSCTASEKGVTLKMPDLEMSIAWDKLAVQSLNEFAASAAPEQPILLALLAHYTGMHTTAGRHLEQAEKEEALKKQADRLKERFGFAARFNLEREIRRLIAEAQALVESKEAEKADNALKKLKERLAGGLQQQFGPEVARLMEQNNEALAERRIQEAINESKRGNWKAVAEIIQTLKKDLGRTNTVRVARAKEIAELLAQSAKLVADRTMLAGVRHFLDMEDQRARAAFTKVAREARGPLAADARAFLKALAFEDDLPKKSCDDLLKAIRSIPDPWRKISAYRSFRKRCPGSDQEAYARSRIGSILLDELERPVLAREVFLMLKKDFQKRERWGAQSCVRLGECEAARGNWPHAEKYFDKVPKEYPDEQSYCARAMRLKGAHYDDLGETDKAVKILEEAVEKFQFGGNSTSGAQLLLARIYRDKLARPEDALKAFKEVFHRSRDYPTYGGPAMLAAAELMAEAGRKDEARALLRSGIDAFAQTKYAVEARKRLQQL